MTQEPQVPTPSSESHDPDHGVKTTTSGGWVLADAKSSTAPEDPPTPPSQATLPPEASSQTAPSATSPSPNTSPLPSDPPTTTAAETTEPAAPAEPPQGKVANPVAETRSAIHDDLHELARISRDSGLHSLYDEIHDERIPDLMAGKFTVVLLGEFNHGKSTVVNALMGDSILPTGITPTTSVITHLVEGPEDKVLVKHRRSPDKVAIQPDLLEVTVRQSNNDSIEYIELHRNNPFLNDGLILVDTPGVNDISNQKVEITYGYLPKADVIIHVLDATQILKKSEIRFLQEKLVATKRSQIFFVLGKVDSLSPDELHEVESYAREKLTEILGDIHMYVFSARQALLDQQNQRTPDPEFSRFKFDVLELVNNNRNYIVFESAIFAGKRFATQIAQNLAIRKSALTLQINEIDERIEAVRSRYVHAQLALSETTHFIDEKIHEIATTSLYNLQQFAASFKQVLPREIETSSPSDIQVHLPNFIQASFQEWLEQEGRSLTNRLESLAIEVIEVTNQTMAETLAQLRSELGLSGLVDLDVNTLVYDVSLLAIGTAGFAAFFINTLLGGVLTLATPLLALYFKGKVDSKIREKANTEGVKAIDAATEAISQQLNDSILSYGKRLNDFVVSAGDHLFRQISETLENVKNDLINHEDIDALTAKILFDEKKVTSISEHLTTLLDELQPQKS